jgi:hypothetical protein
VRIEATSHMRLAAAVVAAGLALAAPARGQVGPGDSPEPLVGCYSFKGTDRQSGGTVEARFRLTAGVSSREGLPRGRWLVVTAVPGEKPQPGIMSWSLGADSAIRVLWDFDSVRVLLQFPQIPALSSDPVEGMLAGPGPERGVAQTAPGSVLRFSC